MITMQADDRCEVRVVSCICMFVYLHNILKTDAARITEFDHVPE